MELAYCVVVLADTTGMPTIVALFLYELIPVVRNTIVGLGAVIGAGGLGSPIIAGLVQDTIAFILEGAVPAAVLAVLADQLLVNVEGVFAYSAEKL